MPLGQRAERILQQAFGGYTITQAPEVDKYCTQKGVKLSDMESDSADLKTKIEAVTSSYKGPRDALVVLIKSNGQGSVDTSGIAGSVIIPVGVPLFFGALAVWSTIFLFFWSICSACCKRTCCLKPQKAGDPKTTGQKFVLITSVLVGLALIATTIAWCILVSGSISSIKNFPCAITILYSDIVKGYKGKDL